ncbi:hypothetical protein NDU88_001458 [Pleurodeles waltl]|uniref:Uncharacterized protein n=1 Tax=Pleurodeles waltl TaxID=8319 RepID=A0AAV7V8B0_PLEWA|nr:hypothetical protein NDU88_001458 [Pleurodeles waltl]
MCGQRYTEKAVRALHWWCTALELRRTCRGAPRIPLRGNSSSASTSEPTRGKKAKSGAPVRSILRVVEETAAGAVGGAAKSQTKAAMEALDLQPTDSCCDERRTVESKVPFYPQANGCY